MTSRAARNAARLLAVLALACGLLPGPARAHDLEVTITRDTLQRFFKAAAPVSLDYEIIKGSSAARISFTNPEVLLTPGRPGRVQVALDYEGQSDLLGLPPFRGRVTPEADFRYDPKRAALRVSLKRLRLQAGKMTLRLDGLVAPMYLPLAPPEPLDLNTHLVLTDIRAVTTRVTQDAVILQVDYRFVRLPRGTDEKQ